MEKVVSPAANTEPVGSTEFGEEGQVAVCRAAAQIQDPNLGIVRWAVKIAVARRCDQEFREVGPDPAVGN
jgi:hypothetical protein